jgi:ketosteroid isomerase-like protein
MTSEALDALAARLFAHFEANDLDAVEAMMAPDATLTQNGVTSSFVEARPMLAGLRSIIGAHRYEEVRRVVGTDAVVEEHRVRSTTPSGVELDLAACVVIRVDGDGRITSLDEYVDTTPLRVPKVPASGN